MDTTAKIWDVEKGVEINTLNVRDMYLVLLKNVPVLKFKIVLKGRTFEECYNLS